MASSIYGSPEEELVMIRKRPISSDAAGKHDPELDAWWDEQAAFDKMRPSLRQDERYRDKFVAVRDHAVVDCDADRFQLVRRIVASYPGDVVFVGHVQRDDPPVELPSPEFEA